MAEDHFSLRLQAYSCFMEFLKVEWEAAPSAIRPLSQFGFGETNTSTFKIDLLSAKVGVRNMGSF